MDYVKTIWTNSISHSSPRIDAYHMNKIQKGVDEAISVNDGGEMEGALLLRNNLNLDDYREGEAVSYKIFKEIMDKYLLNKNANNFSVIKK